MRLVFLGDSLVLQSAGIKQYNLQLLKTLESYPRLSQLTVIVPQMSSELSDYHQVVAPISSLPLHQKWRHFTQIPKLVNAINPDLVIEPAHFGPFRLQSHIKRCTVIHDLTPISHPQFHPVSSRVGHRLTLNPVLRRSDLIITNSETTQVSIRRHQPSVKQVAVVSPPIHNVSKSKSSGTSASLGRPYILAIGTQEPRKDYVTLLEAYAKLDAEIDLVIIGGKGWKNTKFDHALDNHSKRSSITLTGYVSQEEKEQWMANASIFVATSIAEGLGLPLLEILPYQTPVVCSDLPSFREIGGSQFEYFPAGYASVLAQKLSQYTTRLPFYSNYSQRIESWKRKRKSEVEAVFTTFDAWL